MAVSYYLLRPAFSTERPYGQVRLSYPKPGATTNRLQWWNLWLGPSNPKQCDWRNARSIQPLAQLIDLPSRGFRVLISIAWALKFVAWCQMSPLIDRRGGTSISTANLSRFGVPWGFTPEDRHLKYSVAQMHYTYHLPYLAVIHSSRWTRH